MKEEDIVKYLIEHYPNEISVTVEHNHWPILNFVETVDNFAACIVKDFSLGQQKKYFDTTFQDEDECSRHIARYLHSISELCQEWIEDNYYVEGGDLYYSEDDEDEGDD